MNEFIKAGLVFCAGLAFVLSAVWLSEEIVPMQVEVHVVGIDNLTSKIEALEDKNANLEQGRDYWKDAYWDLWCFEFEDDEEECYE